MISRFRFDGDGKIVDGLDAPFDSGFTPTNLMFGDLTYEPAENVICGSTANGPGYFFKYDLNADEGERYH